jgi:thiol:disulfide interchange protein DsbC
VPQAGASCANPVDKIVDVGHKLGINSTPTLIFANGERMSGGLRADDLREMLDRTSTARR